MSILDVIVAIVAALLIRDGLRTGLRNALLRLDQWASQRDLRLRHHSEGRKRITWRVLNAAGWLP